MDPPDRGYDEHQARAALRGLIGSAVDGIRIFTLDELRTSDDGRDVHANLNGQAVACVPRTRSSSGDEVDSLLLSPLD